MEKCFCKCGKPVLLSSSSTSPSSSHFPHRNATRKGIQCPSCYQWFHLECVDLTSLQMNSVCPRCRSETVLGLPLKTEQGEFECVTSDKHDLISHLLWFLIGFETDILHENNFHCGPLNRIPHRKHSESFRQLLRAGVFARFGVPKVQPQVRQTSFTHSVLMTCFVGSKN